MKTHLRYKRRLFALLLCLTGLLAGCSGGRNAELISILKQQADPAEASQTQSETTPQEAEETAQKRNQIVDDTRKKPEAKKSRAGICDENVYRNEFFGFQITLDDTWEDYGLQELNEPLLEAQGTDAEQMPDEIIENMKTDSSLFTLSKVSFEEVAEIRVFVSRIGVKGVALVTTDEIIDEIIKEMLEALPDAQASKGSVVIGTTTFPALYAASMSSDLGEDVAKYVEEIFIVKDDYVAVITLATYLEDDLEDILQYVSLL